MHIPNSEAHAAELARVVREHSHEPVTILVVDDVLTWCRERNPAERRNPPAMALRADVTGEAVILVRREIDADQVQSIKDRMLFGDCAELAARLDTPAVFLEHLVLHELAHLLNDWGQDREDDCDGWAFNAMGWLPEGYGRADSWQ